MTTKDDLIKRIDGALEFSQGELGLRAIDFAQRCLAEPDKFSLLEFESLRAEVDAEAEQCLSGKGFNAKWRVVDVIYSAFEYVNELRIPQ